MPLPLPLCSAGFMVSSKSAGEIFFLYCNLHHIPI